MLMRGDVLLGKIAEIKKDLIELEQQLLAQRSSDSTKIKRANE